MCGSSLPFCRSFDRITGLQGCGTLWGLRTCACRLPAAPKPAHPLRRLTADESPLVAPTPMVIASGKNVALLGRPRMARFGCLAHVESMVLGQWHTVTRISLMALIPSTLKIYQNPYQKFHGEVQFVFGCMVNFILI